jgi:protein-S-isoprenylcysteine O-methyltransferase Ste14
MTRFNALLYGLLSYAISFATILYAIGFLEGMLVPKTIDTGDVVPMTEALLVNLGLMTLFAVQHSVMARKPFKQWLTQYVPAAIERSTYVLLASLALLLLFWQWRPMPAVVWQVDKAEVAVAVTGVSMLGWVIVFTSTFMINHFELFGVHQVVNNLAGREMPAPRFRTPMY